MHCGRECIVCRLGALRVRKTAASTRISRARRSRQRTSRSSGPGRDRIPPVAPEHAARHAHARRCLPALVLVALYEVQAPTPAGHAVARSSEHRRSYWHSSPLSQRAGGAALPCTVSGTSAGCGCRGRWGIRRAGCVHDMRVDAAVFRTRKAPSRQAMHSRPQCIARISRRSTHRISSRRTPLQLVTTINGPSRERVHIVHTPRAPNASPPHQLPSQSLYHLRFGATRRSPASPS